MMTVSLLSVTVKAECDHKEFIPHDSDLDDSNKLI